MNKNDCLSPEKLILYSDGSLPKDELKEVEEHVKNCPSCKQEVDYLKGVFTKIEVASVCPSVDELIEYDPEGEGKRDTFIRSHIKYCSKCNDILNRLSCAVEQFEEPAKDVKTAKLPEKVSKEIERYYPEQKKMSFWQFLSTFFFSKKTIAVFSSIFVILCCLLVFKLTFVPQMIDDKKMSSMNEKITTESKINKKEVDSATSDSSNIVEPNQEQNDDDIIDEILSSVVTEDDQDKIGKDDKKEINSESNKDKNNIEDIKKQTEKDIDNYSNENSNNIELNNEDNMAELPNNIADNKFEKINENPLGNVLEESNESEEMGQLRREYMQGAEVEIHELEDKTAKVSAPKSETPKTVEKPVKRYVIPIKPVDSVNREIIKLNSYSDSLSKNSSNDRVSKKVAEYRKDTGSDNELYKQLKKKLIKDREEPKESEGKITANVQSVLPAKTSVVQKVSNSQPVVKKPVTIPKSNQMETEEPPMAQPMLGQSVEIKSNSDNFVGTQSVGTQDNKLALSKSVSSNSSKLSISPLALEYKINMEIGYGSITITSVNEDGTVYYEIKQNRTLTDEDLNVVNRICGEYKDIKIRFK